MATSIPDWADVMHLCGGKGNKCLHPDMTLTLQDMCLSKIIDEFDRYFLAFSETDDAYVKMLFLFLQKKFSFQIIEFLNFGYNFNIKYIDFLISKHLKVLDTSWLQSCPWETIVNKFAEIGPNLQKVNFFMILEWIGEEKNWQDVIHHLPNVEEICFPNCTDEILKYIAISCPNIEVIDVTNSSQVTDNGIKYLCRKENGNPMCPKLRRFLCRNTGIYDGMVELLKNFKDLEEIACDSNIARSIYMMHDQDLSILDKIEPYNITTLDLSYSPMRIFFSDKEILKVCLTLCPRLKSLNCSILQEKDLDSFLNVHLQLEKLNLTCDPETIPVSPKINITNIFKSTGNKLQSLTLSNCSFLISCLAENCPSLKHLSLYEVNLIDEDVTSTFPFLETCTIEFYMHDDSNSPKATSLLLNHSPQLKHIGFRRFNFSSNDLKTEVLRCCEQCPIENVVLSHSIMEIQFIKDILLTCRCLQHLKVDTCGLNSGEIFELSEFASTLPNMPRTVLGSDVIDDSDIEESYNSSDIDDLDDGLCYEEYEEYEDFYSYDSNYSDDEF